MDVSPSKSRVAPPSAAISVPPLGGPTCVAAGAGATGNITPWYLTDAALSLLADCAAHEPLAVRYTRQGIRYRDEWISYDEEDVRVSGLGSIASNILEPLLNDSIHYMQADAAGLGVTVDTAIDAVCGAPSCANDKYQYEQVREVAAQIAAAMDARKGAAA